MRSRSPSHRSSSGKDSRDKTLRGSVMAASHEGLKTIRASSHESVKNIRQLGSKLIKKTGRQRQGAQLAALKPSSLLSDSRNISASCRGPQTTVQSEVAAAEAAMDPVDHEPLIEDTPRFCKQRRRFVVLTVFDSTLIVILWLLATVSRGDNLKEQFYIEINLGDPEFFFKSLFDVVNLSLLRMTVLLICYARVTFNHWAPAVVSTVISTLFLSAKVLMFFSANRSSITIPQYLLVICSFIVAWCELWFMPVRGQQDQLRDRRHTQSSLASERVVVVQNEHLGRSRASRSGISNRTMIVSDDDFRSALDNSTVSDTVSERRAVPALVSYSNNNTKTNSKEGSKKNDDSGHSTIPARNGGPHQQHLRNGEETALLLASISSAETVAESLLLSARVGTGWKQLRSDQPLVRRNEEAAFYVKAEFPCRPAILFAAIWNEVLRWNKDIVENKQMAQLDPVTEISYSVSAPQMRGYVSSRDFCDVRRVRFDSTNDVFIGYLVSVTTEVCPEETKLVRGTNGPSMFRVSPASPSSAQIEWIQQSDIKGKLPKSMVQNGMLQFFVNYMTTLGLYLQQ